MSTDPAAPASGTVHWIGTGLSTGRSGLSLLCERARRVVLWDRTAERAAARLAALGLAGRAEVRALTPAALAAEAGAGDVLVSMLPAAEHAPLLRLATDRGAHFACTSYSSPELAEQARRAAAHRRTVVLTEAGLDPGIDHLMAHDLVARAREAVGPLPATAVFASYCGGVPAVPGPFRYRFSWAPYGVLAALGSPARYVAEGGEVTAPRPWEATRGLTLAGEEFEAYPNRDSLPFVAQYGIPYYWHLDTFVRGTLRNAGWRAAWREVFDTVSTGDTEAVRALAAELAARHPTTPADRDRVVLSVSLELRTRAGGRWRGSRLLDLTGDPAESAMARCVSLPLAHGVTRILAGALPAGLNRAAETPREAARRLTFLTAHGLGGTYEETASTPSGVPA
ncbi:saccharopine dehydrogenase C-terminal domain-containing protein [Streptomyces sp. NBC_00091]|uniref:saccharopine dehydrogenase C-terminal domain-containing protein n=1 Tax=Streptomyces sp. NBC_00091 TaxID=2975648 RepID=UPI002252B935|nr:saccharopine dehydrogenase C-terminal domain-containing protein [Streptomyces sp. NBC_00091]MCX5381109.1 saccharopine dehydrogenase NADP-binding domain-containing protein [Streptomyces sp. NBC_00091]